MLLIDLPMPEACDVCPLNYDFCWCKGFKDEEFDKYSDDWNEQVCEGERRPEYCPLKEQEVKQYNSHEVACIIADLFGDPCACNFNDIDTWLPYKCDFRETCCPNPVGVACWEQYLKHKEGR